LDTSHEIILTSADDAILVFHDDDLLQKTNNDGIYSKIYIQKNTPHTTTDTHLCVCRFRSRQVNGKIFVAACQYEYMKECVKIGRLMTEYGADIDARDAVRLFAMTC
jgi:hypothetical protein